MRISIKTEIYTFTKYSLSGIKNINDLNLRFLIYLKTPKIIMYNKSPCIIKHMYLINNIIVHNKYVSVNE